LRFHEGVEENSLQEEIYTSQGTSRGDPVVTPAHNLAPHVYDCYDAQLSVTAYKVKLILQ